MFCTHCGRLNDEVAAFCVQCGTPLTRAGQVQPGASPGGAGPGRTAVRFLAQRVVGSHKHISGDVSLTDESGSQVMLARKPSILKEGYELVDGQGRSVGRVDHEVHLTRSSYKVVDLIGSATDVLQVQAFHSKGTLPKCGWEDGQGRQLGSIVFEAGVLGYSLVRESGETIFTARASVQGGIFQKLNELATKKYEVDLYESTFPVSVLLALVASMDNVLP